MSQLGTTLVAASVLVLAVGCGPAAPNSAGIHQTSLATVAAPHSAAILNPKTVHVPPRTGTTAAATVGDLARNAATTAPAGQRGWSFTRTRSGTSHANPTITSMTPSSGGGGTLITIKGSGFVKDDVTGLLLVAATTPVPSSGVPSPSFLTGVTVTDTEITAFVTTGVPAGALEPVFVFTDGWGVPANLGFTAP